LYNAVWSNSIYFSDPTHPNPLFSFQRSNVRHNQDGGQKKPFINRKNDF